MARHQDLTINHRLESWVYANDAARLSATGFVSGDVGRIAYQSDTGNYWRLTSVTPTWASAGTVVPTGGTGGQLLQKNSSTDFDASWRTVRNYNAIGNPNFEVDQINAGAAVTASGKFMDRWNAARQTAGTMTFSAQQLDAAANEVLIPGTLFQISKKFLRIKLTAAQASLGATDYLEVYQSVEGINWRELQYDVHSVSLLVRSSVAGLKFGLGLNDSAPTKTLSKLCTIPNANTWTLITLPNLPVWPSGNFSTAAGVIGYQLVIGLAAGATFTTPANDAWQTGNFVGALGQDNFASKPVNSTFDIAFVQHEPGPICTTLIDKSFRRNYDECTRYYQKSYDYAVVAGALTTNGQVVGFEVTTTLLLNSFRFHKPMAKVPTVTAYNPATGAVNSIRHNNGSDFAVTSIIAINSAGFENINTATLPAVALGTFGTFHYVADTGW